MSLVNDMLQDLDARRGDDSLSRYTAVNVKVGRAGMPEGARKMIISGALLLVVSGAIYLLQKPTQIQAPVVEQQNLAIQDKLAAPVEKVEKVKLATESLPEELTVSALDLTQPKVEEAVVDSKPQQTIRSLLDAAGAALAADRLIIPYSDNAQAYYQQVLALQPEQPEALLGIQAIAHRYYELADVHHSRGDTVKALMLVGRGLSVEPENAALLQLRSKLLAKDIAGVTTFETAAEPEKQIQPEPVSADVGKLVVELTGEAVDRRRAEAAREKAAAGDLPGAVNDLEALQKSGAAGPEVTAALADLYLQSQQSQAAVTLVKEQDMLPAEQAAYILARAQVQSDNLAAAVVTLESHQPVISSYPDYYSLLAGVYQQGGQNRLAADLYRQLAVLQPETFTHWLGLAVSLDNLQEIGALTAFRRVLPMIPEQQSGLIDYVRQRVVALTSNR